MITGIKMVTSVSEWLQLVSSQDLPVGMPPVASVKDYVRECNRLGVIPVSYFLRHVHNRQFSMRYHGLGPLGAKAMSRQLESNTTIEQIDLSGNCIAGEGALYIARVLRNNVYITHLFLAENNLKSLGAAAIAEMLRENATVTLLDLSGNYLKDSDGRILHYLMKHNHSVTTLYLGQNNLEMNAADCLYKGLVITKSIRVLDLSWNHFRLQGAVALAKAVKENRTVRELYLSMNGFGKEGAVAMADALTTNTTLVILDISSNRISPGGALKLSNALKVNTKLEILKIGRNPISSAGAYALLSAVDKNEKSSIQSLHMEGVEVDEEFKRLEGRVRSRRRVTVVRGSVIRSRRLEVGEVDREAAYRRDPITKLRTYCRQNQWRLLDLFRAWDTTGSWSLSRQDIVTGIEASDIEMDKEEISALWDNLDTDGHGQIYYKQLVDEDEENRKEKIEVAKWKREMEEHKAVQGNLVTSLFTSF